MSVSLISCPKCNSWVLSDSPRCPHCEESIDPQAADQTPSLPENPLRESEEDTCLQCGVKVRRGVVRCWNCQAFMISEIEQKYQQMQEGPRPVIYSDLHKGDMKASMSIATPKSTPTPTAQNQGADDDFDLAPDVALYAYDDDFELDGGNNPAAPLLAEVESAAEQLKSTPAPQKEAEGSYSIESSAAAPAVEKPADKPSRPKATEAVPDVDHSVATGGEALWEIAKEESNRSRASRPKAGRNVKIRPGALLVYCPNGHRIEVQERHRGKMGKCPKCRTTFTVPVETAIAAEETADGAAAPAAAATFLNHFADAHVHLVDPTKLKLKPGALAKAFTTYDLALAADGLLVVTLAKKGGLFGGGTKAEDVRKELLLHLASGDKLKNAPGEEKHVFDIESLGTLKVVHPTAYAHESIFGGINVFGPGRIAVRLPVRSEGKLEFLSLSLSQFRQFRTQLTERCGINLPYEEDQIPLTNKTTPGLCHYTDQPIRALEKLEFYQNDPAFELELVGWKCQACGLTLSEDGRKKENIGGKNGKAIAKAKCPKCKNNFGNSPLYNLKQADAVAGENAPK